MSRVAGKAVASVTGVAVAVSLVLDFSECQGGSISWCNQGALEPTHGPHRDQPVPWNPTELSWQIYSTARALPGAVSGGEGLSITLP